MIDNEYSILVGKKKVEYVAYSYRLSEHAKSQLLKRCYDVSFDLRDKILNSPLAWKVRDNRIAIALSLHEYIIVYVPRKEENTAPTVITYIDTKESGLNVIDKMLIAYKDYNRHELRTVMCRRKKYNGRLGFKV